MNTMKGKVHSICELEYAIVQRYLRFFLGYVQFLLRQGKDKSKGPSLKPFYRLVLSTLKQSHKALTTIIFSNYGGPNPTVNLLKFSIYEETNRPRYICMLFFHNREQT